MVVGLAGFGSAGKVRMLWRKIAAMLVLHPLKRRRKEEYFREFGAGPPLQAPKEIQIRLLKKGKVVGVQICESCVKAFLPLHSSRQV